MVELNEGITTDATDEPKILAAPIGEFRTQRLCALCGEPALLEVYRLRKDLSVDRATLRFACAEHATIQLWPKVQRVALVNLPSRRARDIFRGDLTGFYADILREVGGKMPYPEIEPRMAPREKVWLPLEILPQRPVTKGYRVLVSGALVRVPSRRSRLASARQRRKQMKAERRTEKLAEAQDQQ